jgi:hypothetical protein
VQAPTSRRHLAGQAARLLLGLDELCAAIENKKEALSVVGLKPIPKTKVLDENIPKFSCSNSKRKFIEYGTLTRALLEFFKAAFLKNI